MKKLLFLFFFIGFGKSVLTQNVNFEWVAQTGGVIYEKSKYVTLDASGNVYSAGVFGGTVDFDPGPGIFTLSNGEGYISKLDKNRNFIWAKQIEGTFIRPISVKVDPTGNVFVFGGYNMQVDLDPGPAVVSGSANNHYFLIKLDIAGNFIFGRTFAHQSVSTFFRGGLDIDPVGNIYISSAYDYTADLDPGPGTYTLPISGGDDDIFVLKLDQNGNFVWAKGFGCSTLYADESNSLAVDPNGNVFITGTFNSACDFDPGPGVFTITSFGKCPYILKLNTNGVFVWAKHFDPISPYNSQGSARGIAIDLLGNVFIGGYFEGGSLDFDPGPSVYPVTSYNNFNDGFLCKLDASGNFLWAKSIGGSFQDMIWGIAVDIPGNVYATGHFYNTVDFDPGPIISDLTSAGQSDVFIVKFSGQGNFVWAKKIGGNSVDEGVAIAVDASNSVYTIGNFTGDADMDPGPGIVTLTGLGQYGEDIFLLKLSRCTNSSSSVINASVCNNYILNGQTYSSSGTYIQTITNTEGCDSIITLNLIINRKFTSVTASICEGQSYFAGGANQTTSGIYKDTLLTSLGCDSVITTTLTVHPKPKPNLGPDRNLCVAAIASITPGSFSSYLWQDNSTQSNFTVSSVGVYWVTVTDANNCSATDSLKVLAIDTVPTNFLPPNQLICYGNEVKISVPGYKDYLWSTGSVSGNISLKDFGTFYLTVTDFNNCTGIDSIIISRANCIPIGIPNAFTPNGDGKNDVFKPTINQAIQYFSFEVFNRYGQRVFNTREYGTGWDGTYKGKKQPAGSYVYRIKFINVYGWESVNNGSVLLIR